MKKFYSYFICLMMACSFCALTSCAAEEEEDLIEDSQIEQFKKDIVGYWKTDEPDEVGVIWTWRFDAEGNGASYGENWDSQEQEEGDSGTNKFKWSIDQNGLMVLIKTGNDYINKAPGAPYVIKSITITKMTWVTSTGYTQKLTRL